VVSLFVLGLAVLAITYDRIEVSQASEIPAAARSEFSTALGQAEIAYPAGAAQLAKLTTSSPTPSLSVGSSVAIAGETVVVGAPSTEIGSNRGQGAVYVFNKPTSGWKDMTQTAVLTASDGRIGDALGSSVAISRDTIVAGAWAANAFVGAVYVFVRPANGWTNMTETAKLTSSDSLKEGSLGFSVAIDGDTIVAGAPVIISLDLPCRVYVYTKPAGGWVNMTQTAELSANGASSGSSFGGAVAVAGDTLAVSATPKSRAIYVFVKPAGGWKDTSRYRALLAGSDGYCCLALAMTRSTIVGVLGHGKDVVYVFSKPTTGWVSGVETARLSGTLETHEYLYAVAINDAGTAILTGSIMAVSANSGSAYLYVEPKNGWTTTSTFNAKFNASDQARPDEFGSSVAVSNTTAVVGSPNALIQGSSDLGAAYLFGHQ
jgi:hypothetical protein